MAMELRKSTAVAEAIEAGAPVVALESSVLAQGLPWPDNFEVALACEAAVREAGAVPATTAVVDGEPVVGLTEDALERLARPAPGKVKVGSRDLAAAMLRGATGGTTVSATCELAAAAGIALFATGGLGGVHRGVEETMDISSDLWALSRFPVAVVCAGAKSVLDLPRTLELLESLAVPVAGVGCDELPAFFCRSSGLPLGLRVNDVAEAARLVSLRLDRLGQGGLVLALPPPESTSLPTAEVESLLREALADAARDQVRGAAITPYLLARLVAGSGGRTLAANKALLVHNAGFAGRTAVALAALRRRPVAGPR